MYVEKETAIHSSILAWKSYGQGSLEGYSPRGLKELDMTEVTERIHVADSLAVQQKLTQHCKATTL